MTPTEVKKLIDAVLEKVPALRAAGVTELELGDLSVTLGEERRFTPAARETESPTMAPAPTDPFADPDSFPRGFVPGYGPPRDED